MNYIENGKIITKEQLRQEYIEDCLGTEELDNFEAWLSQLIIEGFLTPDDPNFDREKFEEEHYEEAYAYCSPF